MMAHGCLERCGGHFRTRQPTEADAAVGAAARRSRSSSKPRQTCRQRRARCQPLLLV
jgi:hypothetical protein